MKENNKIRWPLSVKLISITVFLVVGVTVSVAFISINTVVDISSKRESDSNLEQAESKAEEINTLLYSYTTRAKLLGTILLNKNNQTANANPKDNDAEKIAKSSEDILQSSFYADSDFVSISTFNINNKVPQLSSVLVKKEFYKEFGIENSNLLTDKLTPYLNVVFAGDFIVLNRNKEINAPIWTIGVPLTQTAQGDVNQIVFADIKLSRLKKSFVQGSYRTVFLVDQKGFALEYPDDELLLKSNNLSFNVLVKKAIGSTLKSGQLNFTDDKKVKWIGAYVKTNLGPVVLAQVKNSTILEPANLIRNQIILFTGLSIAISIIIIFLLSLKITNPIEKLVEIMKLVSTGNLNLKFVVKTGDEIELLSKAFMGMLDGLKERDKIKNIMNKFHGSKVMKNIMKGNLELGGSSKNAVIFFCDIRNFTQMCDEMPPEQVVEMLNQYFAFMVNIINRHNGIVDKFIGDAIMGVWGVPESSPNDIENAVNSCLEMRIALNQFNEFRLREKKQPLTIGMGLNMGAVISGTIGSEERMEYTVIGDSVNVASRIESATKKLGTDFLISETIATQIQNKFIVEFAETVEAKGKSQSLKLFKVLGRIKDNIQKEFIQTPYSDYVKSEDTVKIKIA